jgi:hypothetical protein
MSYFPKAIRKSFVVSGVSTTGSTENLTPGVVGLFDAINYKALAPGQTFTNHRKVIFAVGSLNTKDGKGNGMESFKSEPIFGHNISELRVSKFSKKNSFNTVALGFDGVDTTKNMVGSYDTSYFVKVTLNGRPILNTFQHPLTYTFEVKTPCADACSPTACSDKVDNIWLAEQFIKQISSYQYFKPYIKAERLTQCNNALPAETHVGYTQYNLTVCDNGGADDIALVQMQYPTKVISRTSRTGSYSTYSFWQLTASSAPSAFAQAAGVVLSNCSTCPSGYTFASGGTIYSVTIDNTSNAATSASQDLTAVQAISGLSTAIAAKKVNFELGTSTYIVTFPSSFSMPSNIAADATISGPWGKESDKCTLTSPGTTAWTAGITGYKTERALTMTVTNTDCENATPGLDLAALTAFYALDPSVVSGSLASSAAANCKTEYTITQMSDNILLTQCDTTQYPIYTNLQSFSGYTWTYTVPTSYIPNGTTCNVGIKLTDIYSEQTTKGCDFDISDYVERANIEINFEQVDQFGNRCEIFWPMTKLSFGNYNQLDGQQVIRDVMQSRFYRRELRVSPKNTLRASLYSRAEGLEYGVDVDAFYNAVYIRHNAQFLNNFGATMNPMQEELVFYFKEGNENLMNTFLNLVNGYTESIGIQLPPVHI